MHIDYNIILLKFIKEMGAQLCKTQINNNHYRYGDCFRGIQSILNQKQLSQSEKQMWMINLSSVTQPSPDFWQSRRSLNHICFKQIRKDISRSFPSSNYFSSKNNLQKFQLLLRKFALYFPRVGYTQGLNFLAGYLLIIGFNEEEAFEVLVKLAVHDKLLIIGLYEDSFPLNILFCQIFWKLLEKRLPSIANKIKCANVPDQIWIFQWFISFFLYSFPVQFVKNLSNYITYSKEFSMVTLALGIVNCLKQDISKMKNPDEYDFYEYFNNLKNLEFCQQRINIGRVFSYANSISKQQIDNALRSIPHLQNNLYYKYFLKEHQRQTIYKILLNRFEQERKQYEVNQSLPQYVRDSRNVEHLESFLKKKSKLYRSRTNSIDSRASIFEDKIMTPNFTVQLNNDDQKQQNSKIVMSNMKNSEYLREKRFQIPTATSPKTIIKQKAYWNHLGWDAHDQTTTGRQSKSVNQQY